MYECIFIIPRVCNICPGSGVGVVGGLPGVERREGSRAAAAQTPHSARTLHALQIRENNPPHSLSVSSCDHLNYNHHDHVPHCAMLRVPRPNYRRQCQRAAPPLSPGGIVIALLAVLCRVSCDHNTPGCRETFVFWHWFIVDVDINIMFDHMYRMSMRNITQSSSVSGPAWPL